MAAGMRLRVVARLGAVCNETTAAGIRWLSEHQREDGSWHQEAVTGVFFGTAMLHYRLYAAYFPAWALGRYLRLCDSSDS